MTHEATLIPTIAAAFALAMIFGFVAARLKMPPLVGYLVAGIIIGPHTRGFVGDVALASELADVGVILLLFGIGLHFSIDDLVSVRGVALPGALIQVPLAAAAGTALAILWHWPLSSAIVFGLCLSIASTVVLLRALESRGIASSFDGHVAIGWLIVQDMLMVLVLVLLPVLAPLAGGAHSTAASPSSAVSAMAVTLLKVFLFIILMLVVGKRLLPRLLWIVARTGSRELFTLCVIAAAIGVAYASARLFGVSFALGAFFAGMMMRESSLSHRAAQESLPLQDAFAVLFFVSVGMLFDPGILTREPAAVAATTAVAMLVNPIIAIVLVRLLRYPLSTALIVGAGLGQIGEFSFVLATLGRSVGLLSSEAQSIILGASLFSIAANPIVFAAVARLQRSSESAATRTALDPLAQLPDSVDAAQLTGHVVIIGYGRVGRRIADALTTEQIAHVVVEQNRDLVRTLRARGVSAVSGDASDVEVLIQSHVTRARMLVIATPNTLHARKIIDLARTLNPQIEIAIRTHSDEEADMFRSESLGRVFMGEHELASAMTRSIVSDMREAKM